MERTYIHIYHITRFGMMMVVVGSEHVMYECVLLYRVGKKVRLGCVPPNASHPVIDLEKPQFITKFNLHQTINT